MAFVPSNLEDQSDTAKLLLAMAAEAGMDPHVVQIVRGGFRVPDDLLIVDGLAVVVAQPEMPVVAPPLNPPPAWWNDPAPAVDVIFQEDGKVVLKDEAKIVEPEVGDEPNDMVHFDANRANLPKAEPGLEEMRDWARSNGHVVADKGKLKNVVVEAFKAAHQTS